MKYQYNKKLTFEILREWNIPEIESLRILKHKPEIFKDANGSFVVSTKGEYEGVPSWLLPEIVVDVIE